MDEKLKQRLVAALLARQAGYTLELQQAINPIIRNAEDNEILVYGPIVDEGTRALLEEFGDKSAISSEWFKGQLEGKTDVVMRFNSGGGDVWECSAIHGMCVEHAKTHSLKAVVDGKCASAASLIMLTAEDIAMQPMASIMVHRSNGMAGGNGDEIVSFGNYMLEMDKTIIKLYAERSKMSVEAATEAVQKQTWLTAEQAKEKGLADRILNDDGGGRHKIDAMIQTRNQRLAAMLAGNVAA